MGNEKLRQKAEALISQKNGNLEDKELEVYQMELLLQNEELQRISLENELSRDKYLILYEFAPVGLFTCGTNGLILGVNRAGASLFGVEKDRLLGKAFTSMVIAEHQHDFITYYKLVQQSKIRQECELNLLKNDGTVIYALVEAISENDKGTLCFLVVKDITERKKMENDKLKYERLESLGILAGGIAHDFNNLLTVILGNITLAQTKGLSQEKTLKLLAEAKKACQQTTDLTLQLLTFAKGGEPIKEVLPIVQLLKDTVIFAMRGSNVRYEFDLPEDLWMVEVDGGQIRQVVNNLVINAIQAMPEGGTVFIKCENTHLTQENVQSLNTGPYLKITVKDHGFGIHKDQLHKVFDPYFTTKAQGSGLGLATSYSIVKRHNGHISVQSETGQGTSVYVYLPAMPEVVLSEGKVIEPSLKAQGKILVMDDESSIREMIGEMLAQMGCDYSMAADGKEAIFLYMEAIKRGKPYDAVILDLTIPGGVGGMDALEELLKIDPNVKAIVSSGYSNDAIMTDYKRNGLKAVLPKPFCLEELTRIIRNTISS